MDEVIEARVTALTQVDEDRQTTLVPVHETSSVSGPTSNYLFDPPARVANLATTVESSWTEGTMNRHWSASTASSFDLPRWRVPHDLGWQEYLETITSPKGRFDAPHVRAVQRVWRSISSLFATNVPLPLTKPAADGSIHLAWTLRNRALTVEVYPGGRWEWFFRNRQNDEVDGAELEAWAGVPPELELRLRETFG